MIPKSTSEKEPAQTAAHYQTPQHMFQTTRAAAPAPALRKARQPFHPSVPFDDVQLHHPKASPCVCSGAGAELLRVTFPAAGWRIHSPEIKHRNSKGRARGRTLPEGAAGTPPPPARAWHQALLLDSPPLVLPGLPTSFGV